ncbi:hypothetical protein ABIA30_001259 [Mycobacterium sp. MAA66]
MDEFAVYGRGVLLWMDCRISELMKQNYLSSNVFGADSGTGLAA